MFKTTLAFALTAALLAATAAPAAVTYEFRQVTRSGMQNTPPTEITGRGIIDGDRSRIEITGGLKGAIGTAVITRSGAKRMLTLNRLKKTYTETDVTRMASALGSRQIEITDLKTNLQKLNDHPTIAGFPTDHYRYESSYVMTIMMGNVPLRQKVETVVDRWTTTAFGDVAGMFLDSTALRTGNEQLDKLIESETANIKGLPLRQITSVTTSDPEASKRKSNLELSASRTQWSEILLSNLKVEPVSPALFEIPAGYVRQDPGQRTDEGEIHMLPMESSTDSGS